MVKIKILCFPSSLILKALGKVQQEGASGIFVVPDWPNQPWYPLFKSLIINEPLILEPDNELLLSPCRSKQHPRAQYLRLLAGEVLGRRL